MIPTMGVMFMLIGLALAMLGPVLDEVTVVKRPARPKRCRKKPAQATSTSTQTTPLTLVQPRERERGP